MIELHHLSERRLIRRPLARLSLTKSRMAITVAGEPHKAAGAAPLVPGMTEANASPT
jgi:hypothetical protein